ncbi:sensor histidine kinase [Burkholderia guangdongensis]|uniref:sensor histidine kinase n=1 Tax=Burkholderia guangdongensis TaxID=1792500 RepID=UPI0015CC3269|nr:ATP-binding protein [Burkholderia guangdongensis]
MNDVIALGALSLSAIALSWLAYRTKTLGATVGTLKAERDALDAQHRRSASESTRIRDMRASLSDEMRATAVEELAASLAHEIAQPLSAIVLDGQACLRWLNHPHPPLHEIRECVERIVDDGHRTAETIQRIRARVRRAEPQPVRVALNEVLQELAPLMERETAACGTRLAFELAPALPDVLADPVLLQQLVMNLMQNALEAMRGIEDIEDHDSIEARAPTIIVSTETTASGDPAIALSDNGPGVADEDRERVFEPFFTTKTRAAGIGLSICRFVAQAHGGEIVVHGNAGHGATFTVTFPAAAPRARPAAT